MKMNTPNPKLDGLSHINIYSKGKTELGRLLTNFAKTPFSHPVYGRFESVEGFWYWLKTGCIYEELRTLSGYKAKEFGKILPKVELNSFDEDVLEGIRCKLRQNRHILNLLVDSKLPFEHYYWYGDESNPRVITLPQHQWMLDEFSRIRRVCQQRLKQK